MKRYIRSAIRDISQEAWGTQDQIAENPNTDARTLARLAEGQNNGALVAVAQHPNTPIEVLRNFVASDKIFLHRAMANSYNTPAEILEELINIRDPYVWEKLAENPNTPSDVLAKLHYEQPEDITYQYIDDRLAGNENTPEAVLIDIAANCPRNNIATTIAECANSEEALRIIYERFNDYPSIMECVAKNPHTPEDIIEKLATSDYYFVRCNIANRTDISPELLARLAEDPAFDVLENVLQNPSTPVAVIEKLITNPEYEDLWRNRWVKQALKKRGIKIPKEAQS